MNPTQSSPPETMHLLAQGDLAGLESLALVLEAVGVVYHLDQQTQTLWVSEACVDEALEQLDLYQRENIDWPPIETVPAPHPQVPPTALVLGAMALFFLVTGGWTTNNPWFEQGAVDALAVRQGEWWRLMTGLTLHADSVHLLGNCCLGGVLVHLLSRVVGYGLAWALLMGAGALGNWCNVIARQVPHLSVGFSTAVFAVVGILAGMQVFRHRKPFWKDLVLPLGAGLALLALLGAEGERTDLGAHFFGFVAGIATGLLVGGTAVVAWCRPGAVQRWLFMLAVVAVIGSWWLARN